ncbi:MAG: hypothetical protein KH394_06850 [Atopobium sp.]|nr:hypothetical protein [Atopobium sp.]
MDGTVGLGSKEGARVTTISLNRGVVNDDVTSVDVKAASSTVSEVKG